MNQTTFPMRARLVQGHTALSRSGSVSEEIKACERAWVARSGVTRQRSGPSGPAWIPELCQGVVRHPFLSVDALQGRDGGTIRSMESGAAHRPVVAASFSLEITTVIREVYPDPSRGLLLIRVS